MAAAHASVLDLRDEAARRPDRAGSKAAALARAAAAGFRVVPGFVIVTDATIRDAASWRDAWSALSADGELPLVVRSSSCVEDLSTSSMAGRFTSVTDVRGWEAFLHAVDDVRRSGERLSPQPLAVLVQRHLAADRGGVLFGLDPVTGERDRVIVEVAPGVPHGIVSGSVSGARYELTRRGRILSVDEGDARLTRRDRVRLCRLSRRATKVFAGPQDVEWAVDPRGHLWMLQSRPVTAVGHAALAAGPLLGPGPVGETFPEPLAPLERDLFLAPLRIGMIEALRAVGVVPHHRIAASPVVTTVGGRVATDLELLGWVTPKRGLRVLNPVPPARRLIAAWHVGELRRSLPSLASALVAEIDDRLAAIPPLDGFDDAGLLGLLGRARQELIRAHGYQILAGMLLAGEDGPATAASATALACVRRGRAAGRSDAELVARDPIVLCLVPPRVGGGSVLPALSAQTPGECAPSPTLPVREALRLRTRWLDELAARAAWTLGVRLAGRGSLTDPERVRWLTIGELADVVHGVDPPRELDERAIERPVPPLPATFRLTPDGTVVPVRASRGRHAQGGPRGAGGGRGSGVVRHEGSPSNGPGEVLVVRVLSPAFAGELDGLAGLVAETGSTLSHLAILAREMGIPTVVGMHDALDALPAGATVVVDGTTGEVSLQAPTLPEEADER